MITYCERIFPNFREQTTVTNLSIVCGGDIISHADSVNALYDSLVSIKQESSAVFVRRAI